MITHTIKTKMKYKNSDGDIKVVNFAGDIPKHLKIKEIIYEKKRLVKVPWHLEKKYF